MLYRRGTAPLRASLGGKNMFAVGQRVWLRSGKRSGIVLECSGDQVYLEQDNGAELDYPAHELTAEPPPGADAPGAGQVAPRGAAGSARTPPERTLSPRDITPEHVRVLAAIPVRTLQAVGAVFERKPGAGRFSALDAAGKLNVIAAITAVPYRTMLRYSDRPGELGLLMGKGLADSAAAAPAKGTS